MTMPTTTMSIAAPNSQLAPNLAKQDMKLHRTLGSDVFLMFFNMEDPIVGGLAPHQVALRRAIGLGMDVEREIRLVRGGHELRVVRDRLAVEHGLRPFVRGDPFDDKSVRFTALPGAAH